MTDTAHIAVENGNGANKARSPSTPCDGISPRSSLTATFGDYNQTTPWEDVRSLSWPDLAALLTEHEVGPKEGSCIVPATFRSSRRKMAEAERIEIAMLDSDCGATLEHIANALRDRGWSAIISSTHSHLTTHTTAKRGNWDKFRLEHGDQPDLAEAFLAAERSYLRDITEGATLLSETDTEVILAHQPCPKFRIAMPLRRPWLASSFDDQRSANAVWKERIGALAHALGLRHDQSCTDTARLFYLPRRPASGSPPETLILEGQPCDIFALPPAPTRTPKGRPLSQAKTGSINPAQAPASATTTALGLDFGDINFTDPQTGEVINLTRWASSSGRHFEIVAALKARSPQVFVGLVTDSAKFHIRCPNEGAHTQAGADHATFLVNASQSTSSGFVIHCRHGHCTGHDRLLFLRQMLEQGWLTIEDLQNPEFQPRSTDWDEPWPEHDLTEHRVAEHFAKRSAQQLRFCHTRGAWFVWSGAHWRQNHTRLAFHWIRRMTAKLNASSSGKVLVATSKAAFTSAVERYVQADPALAVTHDDWNQQPWLLATRDGTIDLRTGALLPAERQHLISHLTEIAPSETAACPKWLAFLDQATAQDQGVIDFIQRWLGYCLTGVTREHALLFVYGPGGNGKGVLLNTVSAILKDYAVTAALDTFTAAQGERHSTEIAMLAGARLVITTETEEGRAWAEARIKALTGGDPITARFMRRDFFTFTPAFKLTISGNHKPALRNVDDAARRRFLVLPFIHKPARPNPNLIEDLRPEWPGILRWMIDGCLAWQRQGLAPPQAVREATAEYFAEQDLFQQWLEDRCQCDSAYGTNTTILYRSWTEFLHEQGEGPRSAKGFATLLERQGFKRAKDCRHFRGRGYLGVRLLPANVPQHWQDREAAE